MKPEITFEVSCLRQKYIVVELIEKIEGVRERERKRKKERESGRERERGRKIASIVRECVIDRQAIDRSHQAMIAPPGFSTNYALNA